MRSVLWRVLSSVARKNDLKNPNTSPQHIELQFRGKIIQLKAADKLVKLTLYKKHHQIRRIMRARVFPCRSCHSSSSCRTREFPGWPPLRPSCWGTSHQTRMRSVACHLESCTIWTTHGYLYVWRVQVVSCELLSTVIDTRYWYCSAGAAVVYLTGDSSGAFGFNVFDVVQLGEERVLWVNGDHLPVKLSIIDHC